MLTARLRCSTAPLLKNRFVEVAQFWVTAGSASSPVGASAKLPVGAPAETCASGLPPAVSTAAAVALRPTNLHSIFYGYSLSTVTKIGATAGPAGAPVGYSGAISRELSLESAHRMGTILSGDRPKKLLQKTTRVYAEDLRGAVGAAGVRSRVKGKLSWKALSRKIKKLNFWGKTSSSFMPQTASAAAYTIKTSIGAVGQLAALYAKLIYLSETRETRVR